MTSKSKKVTYEESTDYLEPLQNDLESSTHPLPSSRKSKTKKPSIPISYYASKYFLVSILLYVSVPITQFVVGIIYVGQCPFLPFLPIYMILSGIFGIAFVIVGVIIYVQWRRFTFSYERPSTFVRTLKPILIFLFLFVLGWWTTGHVLVFEIKTRVDLTFPVLPEYCQMHLYKAAYVLVFINHLLITTAIILAIVKRIVGSDSSDSDSKKKSNTKSQTRK